MSDLREKVILKGLELGDGMEKDVIIADQIISLCQPQWISVEDRLPKFEQQVLVTDGKITIESVFNAGGFKYDYNHETIYWQPLPEPPEINE